MQKVGCVGVHVWGHESAEMQILRPERFWTREQFSRQGMACIFWKMSGLLGNARHHLEARC